MPPQESLSLSGREFKTLERNLKEGARRGLLVDEGNSPATGVAWRFRGVGLDLLVLGYRGKRLRVVYTGGAGDVLREFAKGAWEDLDRRRSDVRDQASTQRPRRRRGTRQARSRPATRIPVAAAAPLMAGVVSEQDLSEDQIAVYRDLVAWVDAGSTRSSPRTLGGYAGTGKSTLLGLLAKVLVARGLRAAFCAFTGKAVEVLRGMLIAQGVALGDRIVCTTIHGLIYCAVTNPDTGEIIEWRERDHLDHDLIVVDEASMVGEDEFESLQSYGVSLLGVGDPAQLPPVVDNGDRDTDGGRAGAGEFEWLKAPDLRLERIHRQAEGNPIIRLSMAIRQGADPRTIGLGNRVGDAVRYVPPNERGNMSDEVVADVVRGDVGVLCWTNRTRVDYNNRFRRRIYGANARTLEVGEPVICLRNMWLDMGLIANGARGVVVDVADDPANKLRLLATIQFPAQGIELTQWPIARAQFGRPGTYRKFTDAGASSWEQLGDLFDYAYVQTVHKAQGAQFREVMVLLDPRLCGAQRVGSDLTDEFRRRWLYTAVTRAREAVVLVELAT